MPYWGETAALLAAACWSISGAAFEAAGRRIGSLSLNLIRLLIAFAFHSALGLARAGAILPVYADGEAWAWLAASGLVGFTFGDLFLFRALVLIGARLTLLVALSATPVLTALFGLVALGETLSPVRWVGVALTVAGVAWVLAERAPAGGARAGENAGAVRAAGAADDRAPGDRAAGVAMAMAAAVGQAAALVLAKLGMEHIDDAFAATQVRVAAGIAGFSIVYFATGWWRRALEAATDGPAMGLASLGAFFGPFLGVALSLYAVHHTEAGVAAALMSVAPIVVIPVAVLVFRERVGVRAIGGATAAVAGVAALVAG